MIVFTGLNCGNLIFNNLFEDNTNQMNSEGPTLNIDALKEIVSDYKDRLVSPVYIGIRKGYLSSKNEEEIRLLANESSFVVDTPINVTQRFVQDYLFKKE